MVKNNNIIELKGQRYDATTGALVTDSGNNKNHRTLNGVLPPATVHKTSQAKAASQLHTKKSPNASGHAVKAPSVISKPLMHDVKRHPVSDLKSHAPQHPKTLMRSAVQKPKPGFSQRLRAQSPTDLFIEQPAMQVTPKLLADTVDNKRLKHARVVSKSQLIRHYNLNAPLTPVSRPVLSETPLLSQSRPQVAPLRRPQTTSELLQRAVQQATSHEQPPVRLRPRPMQHLGRHSRRIIGVGTMVGALTLLIGFLVHQNMSNIKLDLASAKAGFTASMPADQPAGFSLASLSTNAGKVALDFHSNSDASRTYTITEQPSTWDSDTLRDMYVSGVAQQFQTIEAAGRTLYVYGQQNVTWVNGGIWYQVKSAGSLSDQQLIDIATSL